MLANLKIGCRIGIGCDVLMVLLAEARGSHRGNGGNGPARRPKDTIPLEDDVRRTLWA